MMKKLILLLLLIPVCNNMQAQEVYDYLLDKQEQTLNNVRATDFELKVAQFQYTAMRYFRKNGIQIYGKVTDVWLDTQALSLSQFLTYFFQQIRLSSTGPKEVREKILKTFIKACEENPMFSVYNKEEAESFVNDKGGYTPFSLNTDWEKALKVVEQK